MMDAALSDAALRADVPRVRSLLAAGAPVEGGPDEENSPLFLACGSDAPAGARLETARLLIEAGAFTRRFCAGGATPLHQAARRGPAALVELLLRNGALFWQEDARGRRPFDEATDGAPIDRDRILYMLADGPKIEDPVFRDAVAAIQSGDADTLEGLLDAHPRLLRERTIEPDFGSRGYFSDPALFWFVANNPSLVPKSPDNIVEIAGLMIARGVEQSDLDHALGLVMTNGQMPQALQLEMVRTLYAAGARADRESVLATLGHKQTAPVAWLTDHGLRIDAAVAAGLGRTAELAELLAAANEGEKAAALAMATINSETEAVRLCLEAGADPNRLMPCHSHSTPLHQAALEGDIAIMELLIAHGADPDIEDTLWHGTPLGWALHGQRQTAIAYLRALAAER